MCIITLCQLKRINQIDEKMIDELRNKMDGEGMLFCSEDHFVVKCHYRT
jgi:hypothetical protein